MTTSCVHCISFEYAKARHPVGQTGTRSLLVGQMCTTPCWTYLTWRYCKSSSHVTWRTWDRNVQDQNQWEVCLCSFALFNPQSMPIDWSVCSNTLCPSSAPSCRYLSTMSCGIEERQTCPCMCFSGWRRHGDLDRLDRGQEEHSKQPGVVEISSSQALYDVRS